MHELERPFDYPGRHNDDQPMQIATELGSFTRDSEDGESFTRFTVYSFTPLADAAEINEYIHEMHPATRCEHDYDCCGRFYGSGAQWDFASRLDRGTDGQTVIVRQGFHCNI